MADVYLGLGSNLGDRERNISQAVERLKEHCVVVRLSSLHRTEPVGYRDQPWFMNGVVHVNTRLEPGDLLRHVQSIEVSLKRVKTFQYGPRTIDLDLLFYDDRVIREPGLIVPHPRLHERMFVLAPLAELAPDLRHPELQKTVRELLRNLKPSQQVHRGLRSSRSVASRAGEE